MILTEQNCPTLRFIKWNDQLQNHPEFIRSHRKGSSTLPFLSPIPQITKTMLKSELDCMLEAMTEISRNWAEHSSNFRKDVWLVSATYGKAFENVSDSIAKHRTALYKRFQNKPIQGVHIASDKGETVSVMYDFTINDVNGKAIDGRIGTLVNWTGEIVVVNGRNLVAWAKGDNTTNNFFAIPKLAQMFTICNNSVDAGFLFSIMDQIVFREWADIKIVDAKSRKQQRKASSEGLESVKTTLQNVRFFDASWYTEIVRTEGFPRRGYWGIRWKGKKGSQYPELVPVRATTVKGYIRHARKDGDKQLNQIENL